MNGSFKLKTFILETYVLLKHKHTSRATYKKTAVIDFAARKTYKKSLFTNKGCAT